jgi:hypothetical protein
MSISRMMAGVPLWARIWMLAGAVMLAAMNRPAASLPADRLGVRRFVIDVDAASVISQTFVMTANQFNAIELSARVAATRPSGALRFELWDLRDEVVVHATDVGAAEVAAVPAYRFEFPPISDSRNRTYRLDIFASPDRPGHGVGLRATKGERYRGGTLLLNDRERWADLAFTTFAAAARSPWRRLLDASAQPGLSTAEIVAGSLAGYWLALGVVLRGLLSKGIRPANVLQRNIP